MKKKSNVTMAWIFVAFYSGLIFYLSSMPHLKEPISFYSSDKFYHFFEYGFYGFLMINALLKSGVKKRVILFALIISSLYGASDEIHQAFVPNRTPDIRDWIFDTIGAYLGIVFYLLLRRKKHAKD